MISLVRTSDDEMSVFMRFRRARRRPVPRKRLLFSSETQARFSEALGHKFESPEWQIRLRCYSFSKVFDPRIAAERTDPVLVEHLCSLWKKQNGRCAVTGRQMLWSKEDVAAAPLDAVSISRLRLERYGERWTLGNVALTCAFVATALSLMPLSVFLRCATRAAAFVEFKEGLMTEGDALALWDDHLAETGEEPRWTRLSPHMRKRLVDFFLRKETLAPGEQPKSPRSAAEYAEHCADVFERQRGRCALTGVRIMGLFTESQLSGADLPSADRIDPGAGHVPGNVRITTVSANSLRQNLLPRVFWQFMADACRPVAVARM